MLHWQIFVFTMKIATQFELLTAIQDEQDHKTYSCKRLQNMREMLGINSTLLRDDNKDLLTSLWATKLYRHVLGCNT